jgi:ABC-type anion transport system duplicated permease subunit
MADVRRRLTALALWLEPSLGRVVVLLAFATVIWAPIGVWIGMNAKVTRLAQPVVQVLASFPRTSASRSPPPRPSRS